MSSRALAMPAYAASTACSTVATNVITDRLCDASDDTSRMRTDSTAAIAERIASTMSGRRPSEKFGTHSTSFIGGQDSRLGIGTGLEAECLTTCAGLCVTERSKEPVMHRAARGYEASMRET